MFSNGENKPSLPTLALQDPPSLLNPPKVGCSFRVNRLKRPDESDQTGVISAAVEVMNEGSIDDDPPKPIHGHVADIQVPGNVLSLSEHMVMDSLCVCVIASVTEEGHEASQDMVVRPNRLAK